MNSFRIEMLPVDRIDTALRLQRGSADRETIERLVPSIGRAGLLNAILVIQRLNEEAVYDLISGLHRFEAAKRVGLTEIPARVLAEGNGITRELLLDAVDEDTARKTIHPLELAEMIKAMEDLGMATQEVREHLHLSKSHVNNLTRLLVLPSDVCDMIRADTLALAKGRALAGIQELGLPHDQLQETIRELAATTTPAETCADFNNRVQSYKAERMRRPAIRRARRQVMEISQIERQADRWMAAVEAAAANPEHAAQLSEILETLQTRMAAVSGVATGRQGGPIDVERTSSAA